MKLSKSLLSLLFVCGQGDGGVSCGAKWKENAGIPHSHNKPHQPARNLIAFGEDVDKFEYPWVVKILTAHELGHNICTGSLISERHILTAAHCFDPGTKIERIQIDGINVGLESSIEIHPKYEKKYHSKPNPDLVQMISKGFYDIAMITLKTGVCETDGQNTKIRAIALPKKVNNPQRFPECTVWHVGWGYNIQKGQKKHFPETLQEAQQTIDPKMKCWDPFGSSLPNVQKILELGKLIVTCDHNAYHPEVGMQGDSGGPLMMNIANGKTRYVQIGVFILNHPPLHVDVPDPKNSTKTKRYTMFKGRGMSTSALLHFDWINKHSENEPKFICIPGCDMQYYGNKRNPVNKDPDRELKEKLEPFKSVKNVNYAENIRILDNNEDAGLKETLEPWRSLKNEKYDENIQRLKDKTMKYKKFEFKCESDVEDDMNNLL